MLFGQNAEDDDLIDPVDELRPEAAPEDLHQIVLQLLEGLVRPCLLLDAIGAQVRGHDCDRVLEVDRASLRVGEAPVVEDLEQDVEHVGVCLLDLVEEQHRVGAAPYLLRELSGLLVSHVTRRRADESRNRVTFLEFTHVEPDHEVFAAEERLGKRARELSLAHAGRAQEEEAADRLARIAQSCT